MKNLNKLGLVFGFGTLVALCAGGCSSDSGSGNTAGTAGTTAGNSTGGTTAGASTGGAGASTGGAGASTGGAGASTGGGGAGGAGAGTGGGGAGGVGGVGGAGGAGGGGGMGGGPSADCMTWCVGDKGLPKVCMGSNLLNPLVSTVDKCLAECAKPANAAGLQCWITHTGFVKMMSDQDPHCGHASGDPGKAAPCTEITQ